MEHFQIDLSGKNDFVKWNSFSRIAGVCEMYQGSGWSVVFVYYSNKFVYPQLDGEMSRIEIDASFLPFQTTPSRCEFENQEFWIEHEAEMWESDCICNKLKNVQIQFNIYIY